MNTVCLVSLEGWARLPEQSWTPGMPAKIYRLVVLGSWRFTSQGSSDFKSRMRHLDDECLLGQAAA